MKLSHKGCAYVGDGVGGGATWPNCCYLRSCGKARERRLGVCGRSLTAGCVCGGKKERAATSAWVLAVVLFPVL